MVRLYLDDLRIPIESFIDLRHKVYLESWEVVRSFDEFTEFILKHGLPDIVSFDCDLDHKGKEPYQYCEDYYESQGLQEKEGSLFKLKTGLHTAEWLVQYCKTENKKLPRYLVHSLNQVGRDNIVYVLKHYEMNRKNYLTA